MTQRTDKEGPPDSETANVEAGVEATSALFDGLENTGIPL